jgi:hypothetical protein
MHLYIFNAEGRCQLWRTVDCEKTATAIVARLGAPPFVLSHRFIRMECAFLIDGVLCERVPEIDRALAQAKLREQRDLLLIASDWTQLPDVPLSSKQAWAHYRQALRDLTTQPGFPLTVTWPLAPIVPRASYE